MVITLEWSKEQGSKAKKRPSPISDMLRLPLLEICWSRFESSPRNAICLLNSMKHISCDDLGLLSRVIENSSSLLPTCTKKFRKTARKLLLRLSQGTIDKKSHTDLPMSDVDKNVQVSPFLKAVFLSNAVWLLYSRYLSSLDYGWGLMREKVNAMATLMWTLCSKSFVRIGVQKLRQMRRTCCMLRPC